MASVISSYIQQLDTPLKRRYLRRPMVEYLSQIESKDVRVIDIKVLGEKQRVLHIALEMKSDPPTDQLINFYGYCILPNPKGNGRYYFPNETVKTWLNHAVRVLLDNNEKTIHVGYDTLGVVPLDLYGFLRNFNTYLSKLVLNPEKALHAKSYYLKVKEEEYTQEGATVAALKKMMGLAVYKVDSMEDMIAKINKNHLKKNKPKKAQQESQ